ncbi:MAG: glycosyltransferase family 4 protein, partial [Candidatus Nanohaloarchaea archaeon]
KALDETDEVDVTVLAVNQDEVEDDGLDVEQISVPRFPNELAYYRIYKELSRSKDDYDVIQGQHSLTVPPLGLLDDVPTVGVIRDYWPICYRTTLRDRWGNNHLRCGPKCAASTVLDWHVLSPYKFFNHYLRRELTRKVDVLAARSEFVEERLNDHGFEDTVVRYNFVPDGFGDGIEPEGEGDVLYVGKLTEQKGPQLLVEAIPEVLEERPDQRFTFLGDGPLREELEERVRTSQLSQEESCSSTDSSESVRFGVEDSVEFRGHVPKEEVIARMKGASVVVSPSLWHEPLSRVVIESASLGTPVVTAERGGNPEAVEAAVNPTVNEVKEEVLRVLGRGKDVPLSDPPTESEAVEDWAEVYNGLL